jgi:uncharacterized protein
VTEHPNAALVRRLYEAFRTRDRATLTALIADDAVWHVPGSTPISGTHRRAAAIFAYFQALGERSGATFHAELVDAFGSDRHAVALATATGQPAGRGYVGRYLLLMTIRRDRIAEAHPFNDDQAASDAFWS